MLNRLKANLANPEVARPVPTNDALSSETLGARKQKPVAPHTVHTDMNEAKLALSESQAQPPTSTDNQPFRSEARLLPALCERDSDTAFTDFRIHHFSTEPDDLDPSIPLDYVGVSASPTQPLLGGGLQPQSVMEVPEMLSRFLRVDGLNDSLRYEASIAISEGRAQEGEDILKKKMSEEYWQWTLAPLSTMAMNLNSPSEWSHSMEDDREATV